MASLMLTLLVGGLTACKDAVWEDEPVCPQGLSIRFVYDYNMEFANAFPSQVHCVTVFIYDENGRYVKTVTETDRSKLADENWRMNVDLPEGTYQVVAYGGMACDDASFSFEGGNSLITDRRVALKPSLLTSPKGPNLHPLFYGELKQPGSDEEPELPTVEYNDANYRDVTVYMMKDTNNIRILLHNADGTPVDGEDFTYSLTADNTLFNYDNALLLSHEVTYWSWIKGNVENKSLAKALMSRVGEDASEEDDPVVGQAPSFAFAEISTSRFVTDLKCRLTIEQISTGRTVLSIPLVKYLLMYKSENISRMGNQEFLDRKSEWELTLFLDSETGGWGTVTIWIEDWRVRINNIEQ